MNRRLTAMLICVFLFAPFCAAQDVKIFHDFEQDPELKAWEFKKKSASLSDQHATHGQKSLKISSDEYLFWYRVVKDWSGYDSLDMDIFVEGDEPVGGTILIGDEAWKGKDGGSYWNRHNGSFNLKPGANTISIPVNGLFRGEAGSRGNDIKSNIDPKAIMRLDIGFKSKGKPASIYLDYMRLVKESRPAGILAFDFGPESQTVFPGFTPIAWNTVYGKDGNIAGLRRAQWGPNSAKDDTFPTRLYQDCVMLDGAEFIAEVPNGKCHIWVMFNDLGYWGGEQARFRKRWIESGGQQAWSEDRGEDGPGDYLFHFENIEPKPGDSMWDLYMKYLFTPKRFEATATDGKLSLRFGADGVLACKVAAIIIYPDSIKADAEKWVAEVEGRNRKEFEARAAFMGPKRDEPAPGPDGKVHLRVVDVPADSWLVGIPALDTDVGIFDGVGPADRKMERYCSRGQRISFTFAILSFFDDRGECPKFVATDLRGANGSISSSEIDLRYVHQALHRGFNDIAYAIGPESLRKTDRALILCDEGRNFGARQLWITVHVPLDAGAGKYDGQILFTAGKRSLRLPITVNVLDLTLDEPDFLMGFYGTHIPNELPPERKKTALRDLFTLLKEYGMNSVSGGPGIKFSGFDADGKPKLDFAACDEFFKAYKECGFTKPVVAYGGPGMVQGLHDGYVVGETGHNWEKKTAKPFGELLKIVWSAVKEHADKEGWPPIYYEFNDETRTAERAKEELALQKLYREFAPWVQIGGSYSVHWDSKDPLETTLQETFKTFTWSALNLHTQTDLDKAKEFGRELHIYNQGATRYSFGAYQWAEYRKGVRGRMQWHLLALHGYQFFDLDGREPDTAMINWGKKGIIPTLSLARCREGADDFRFAVTLWNMAQKKKETPEGKAAIAWLDEVANKIGVGQRTRPKDFMDDEAFRETCIRHIKKLQAAK